MEKSGKGGVSRKGNDPSAKGDGDDKPVKVDKWDGTAVKNALDDGAKKVMTEKLGFQESNRLMDGRLVICTVSVAFAIFALIWDYLHPFPESRPVLIVCVVSYFLMMAILSLYTSFKERGIFLVALEKDIAGVDPDNTWQLASTLKRYDDMYSLHMTFVDGQTQQQRTTSFMKSVACFYDDAGFLCMDLFEPEMRKLYSCLTNDKKDK